MLFLMKTYETSRGKSFYITQFYNQINFFISLINGSDVAKCGRDTDVRYFAVGRFDMKFY
jgi:hypothetical protein